MYSEYFSNALNQLNDSNVKKAMEYVLFSKGKQLRSKLLIELVKAYGLDEKEAYPAALALEMIHTYSLVHDDLPAMDNDDYRRGRLTCHKQFNEAIAILAGDALLTEAFSVLTNSFYSYENQAKLVSVLAKCAGANGMILGQDLDMEANALNLDELVKVHHHKTGELFAASFMMASVVARKEENIDLAANIGYKLGLAFQVQDDVFDVTKTIDELGKMTNSDVANDKKTVLKFMSLNQANNWFNELYDECINSIIALGINEKLIVDLINGIRNRRN